MSRQSSLTQARLKELLRYDPGTGEFTWRVRRGRQAAGTRAGCTEPHGYVTIRVDKVLHCAHRLAWFYVYGVWPPVDVDHINGKGTDNRIANLRPATKSENQQNRRRPQRNNKLGVMGVHRHGDKFQAAITLHRACIYLGLFLTLEEAEQAYLRAKAELHPFNTIANAS